MLIKIFWWAVDKAISGRKINDIATIETSLQQYKTDKNYYPSVNLYDAWKNLWWYSSWVIATPSNRIKVSYNGEEIESVIISDTKWWWVINGTWTYSSTQIWSKWTIWRSVVWRKYLSKDLYDPEIWDLKVNSTNNKRIDYGLGRYIYAVYRKPRASNLDWWNSNKNWINYNLAFTIKKSWGDSYIAKIVWDYDEESCYEKKDDCPENLIWIPDWTEEDGVTTNSNYWVPYAVADFAE